jgi:hypothetical protein
VNKNPVTHKRIAALKLPKQVALLLSIARAIAQALQSNNKAYPNPDPSVAAITTAADALEAAEAAVRNRAKNAVAARNTKRDDLVTLLVQERGYVQKIADADVANAQELIEGAQMSVKKVPARAPRAFGAKSGPVPGSVVLVAPSAGPRSSYDWEYSVDGGKTWQMASPTMQARTTLLGLQSAVTHAFRYRSVTKVGASDWSEPVTLLVR